MKRTNIGNGHWFDQAAATLYEEDSYFNGSNRISRATGSQWEHEELYHTVGGAWVLHEWTQWQGGYNRYREIAESQAHAWLVNQGHDLPEEILAAAEV